MNKTDYSHTFDLLHNEAPAKINLETGEVKMLTKPMGKSNPDKMKFEPNAQFSKTYTKSWKYLDKVLKPHEFKAAYRLACKAKAFTNSLEPLNDETVLSILVEELGISKNQVKPVLKHLFDLGVYGKFEVADSKNSYTRYWILNPYLSFNGTWIDKTIADLFKDTLIAKAFRGEIVFN